MVVFMIAVCGVALVGFGVLGCLVILRWFWWFWCYCLCAWFGCCLSRFALRVCFVLWLVVFVWCGLLVLVF